MVTHSAGQTNALLQPCINFMQCDCAVVARIVESQNHLVIIDEHRVDEGFNQLLPAGFVGVVHVRKPVQKIQDMFLIRQTMWNRRQLLRQKCCERNRPARWSQSPIKLRTQYEHVYLTTAERLAGDLSVIWAEDAYINDLLDGGTRSCEPRLGDIERWPKRLFVNPATDLLKYVYFFAAVTESASPKDLQNRYAPQLQYELYIQPQDEAILEMYPQVFQMEEVEVYLYQSEPNIK